MGVSIDAMLAYGLNFGENDPMEDITMALSDVFDDEEVTFEEWYLFKYHDLCPPRAEDCGYDESQFNSLPYEEREQAINKHYEESGYEKARHIYWEKKREFDIPVDLTYHGVDEWSMHFLCLKSSFCEASLGYPEMLNLDELSVEKGGKDLILKVANDLLKHCAKWKMEDVMYNNEVGWHLFSRKW